MSDIWGILGSPTKTEIEFFKNMPYGKFKEHVQAVKKKSKGKKHEIYKFKAVRDTVTRYTGTFSCGGFGYKDAYQNAQDALVLGKAGVVWEHMPEYRDKEIVRLA